MIINLLKMLATKFWMQYKTVLFNLIVGKLDETVIAIVNQLRDVKISDADKRNEAFKQIKDIAIRKGMDLKDNAIHQAISLGIDIIKGK